MEDFTPRKVSWPSLTFITRPSRDEEFVIFTSEQDGFEAFIHQKVRQTICEEAYKASPNETIGLLAGRVLRDERGPYTLVLKAHGARRDEVEATPSHVRISAAGHAQVRRRLEVSAYGLDMIGWYHSHPRYHARFSPVDVTEQSTWRNPNHLGIVISGFDVREPFGVYRGPQATLLTPAASFPVSPPIATLPAAALTLNPQVEEVRSTPVENSPVANSGASVPIATRAGQRAGWIPWAVGFGLLGVLVALVWLDRRLKSVETSVENIKMASSSGNRSPHENSTVTDRQSSAEPAVSPNQGMAADKNDAATHPATKAAKPHGSGSHRQTPLKRRSVKHTQSASPSNRNSERPKPKPPARPGTSVPLGTP